MYITYTIDLLLSNGITMTGTIGYLLDHISFRTQERGTVVCRPSSPVHGGAVPKTWRSGDTRQWRRHPPPTSEILGSSLGPMAGFFATNVGSSEWKICENRQFGG